MHKDCVLIRKRILQAAHSSGHGHIPTCFSVVEMLYALYGHMRHRPDEPDWPERDLFVLSKGHAALAHYMVLAFWGYFDWSQLKRFGLYRSKFGCHADRHKVPGVEVSTGSLGHGLSVALGMALAEKIKGSERQVYTLIGDGEANEGTVWESLLVADNLKLDNYTVLYDDNRSHGRGLQIQNPEDKFASFGAQVMVVNGHDLAALERALAVRGEAFKVIVCRTVKGYGASLLVNDPYAWHRRAPNDAELAMMLEELDAQAI